MKFSTRLEREMMQLVAVAREKNQTAAAEQLSRDLAKLGWHYCQDTTNWARAAMRRPTLDAWLPADSKATKERRTLTLPKGAVIISRDIELEIGSLSGVVLEVHFPH